MDYVINDILFPIIFNIAHYLPERFIRLGIRLLLKTTLNENNEKYFNFSNNYEQYQMTLEKYVENLKERDIAENTHKANEQHYEVPAELYQVMLGKRLKYSSCLWYDPETNKKVNNLNDSEDLMFEKLCERANIDGTKELHVLDLGKN